VLDRSHALRGNAARDALRHKFMPHTRNQKVDAERRRRHYHAERGNDHLARLRSVAFPYKFVSEIDSELTYVQR